MADDTASLAGGQVLPSYLHWLPEAQAVLPGMTFEVLQECLGQKAAYELFLLMVASAADGDGHERERAKHLFSSGRAPGVPEKR